MMSTKKIDFDLISSELEESGVEEIDLTESGMYKRAFRKFYYKQTNNITEDEDNTDDCDDIEDDEMEVDFSDSDLDIEDIEDDA
jgi:hypothetical protein